MDIERMILWLCLDCERMFALDDEVTEDDDTECPYCGSEKCGAVTQGVS